MGMWESKNYRIKKICGCDRWLDGYSNGTFAHNFSGTLTHLETGYKVAVFKTLESARLIGDYLTEKYAVEFKALKKTFTWTMTEQEYKQLPAAIDLMTKLRADEFLTQHIKEFAIVEKEENDDSRNYTCNKNGQK